MACSRRLGNMYTASLYGCLASLLATVEPAQLKDKRVSLFSFGSGCASSFFTLRVKGDTSEIKGKMQLIERLSTMSVVPPEEFVAALAVRDQLLSVLGAKLIILLAPGEESQCGQLHSGGSRGEHLAWSLLPGQRRCQIPTKVRQGSSRCLNILSIIPHRISHHLRSSCMFKPLPLLLTRNYYPSKWVVFICLNHRPIYCKSLSSLHTYSYHETALA